MPASSNFNQAIREAQSSSIVGPNVVSKALPYVGGGMALTGAGVLGGVSLLSTNPSLFSPLETDEISLFSSSFEQDNSTNKISKILKFCI